MCYLTLQNRASKRWGRLSRPVYRRELGFWWSSIVPDSAKTRRTDVLAAWALAQAQDPTACVRWLIASGTWEPWLLVARFHRVPDPETARYLAEAGVPYPGQEPPEPGPAQYPDDPEDLFDP